MILGPIVGSILYTLGGFAFTFYIFGTLFIVTAFYITKIFPKTVDVDNTPTLIES